MSKFAKKLKKARTMATREAEDIIKLGNGSISRYERDLSKPSFETVVRLARLYGADIDDLADTI